MDNNKGVPSEVKECDPMKPLPVQGQMVNNQWIQHMKPPFEKGDLGKPFSVCHDFHLMPEL